MAFVGRIFNLQPGLIKRIPGHFIGERMEQVVPEIESVLSGTSTPAQLVPPGVEYTQALSAFLTRRGRIELELDESSKILRMPLEYIYTANRFMGENILAALRLGE